MELFKKLGLEENLLKAIAEVGFKEPTEIQAKTIPLTLEGKDIIGSSATGSGKTLAFGSVIIEKSQKGKGIQALILTPTRELAEQVAQSLRKFSKYYNLRIKEIYGGVSIEGQIQDLERSEIVVGTPGRVLDHISRNTINLQHVKFLVLDEADRMLDMGFIDDVDEIIKHVSKERQTLMFSATISQDIVHLSKKYMKHPMTVEAESYVDPSKLSQDYYDVPNHLKFSLLVYLLRKETHGLIMIFCNTRNTVDFIEKNLKSQRIYATAIHGGLSQNRRNSIMKDFHSKKVSILVCTDVAARGLDIKNVTHIYNYDCPKTPTEYVHRIGRTARAGKEGKAITLVSDRDYENFSRVQQDDELKISKETLPYLPRLHFDFSNDHRGRGGRFDKNNRGNRDYRDKHDDRPRPGNFSRREESGSDFYALREKKLRGR